MDSSENLRPRKRKQCSSSNIFNGRLTRSKSRMLVHNTRSGRTWSGAPVQKPFDEAQLLLGKHLEKPRNLHGPSPENEASLGLSIKDLRTRARRVFLPTIVGEEEDKTFKVGIGFPEEGCNGVSKLVDDHEILDLGILDSNPDMDSYLGSACSGKEESRVREDMGSVPLDVDTDLGLGTYGQPDEEENVHLSEKTPEIEKRTEGNNVECWRGREIKRNGSISGSKSVLNSFSKRKVFKAPSSFSYRRLLPFLVEMAKDDSGTSKLDVVDINNVDCNSSSAFTERYAGKYNHADDHYHTKTIDGGDCWNSWVKIPVNGQDFDAPTKKIAKTEENIIKLSNIDQRNHEDRMNGVNTFIEEFVQTTPPDDTTFSKLDNDNVGASQKCTAAQHGNHVDEEHSIGNNASNGICISMKPHPTRKSNSIGSAKRVLKPCLRLEIIKSSSFSYRRLLPFLTDIAKGTTNIDEPPKFQRDEDDNHAVAKEIVDENVPVDRTRTDNFLENRDPKYQEPLARPVDNSPTNDTAQDSIPDASTQFFSAGDSLLNENSDAVSSKAIAKIDDVRFSERTSESELLPIDSSGKLEIELSTNVVRSCRSRSSCSTDTPCSKIYEESTRESKPVISHVSDHEPTDIAKQCMVRGLDCNTDEVELVKSVSLCHSSLESEEFDNQGNQSDSPTKGILKINTRGCRGLCNCLDCCSFRQHAERSFEFSKNQMLDAEVVAHELIHELSNIRSLLEKSIFGDSDLVAVQINQAKEACERALRTEQQAKNRLNQMLYDLKIHCRIRSLQRPRVTFSRHIEEIALPKTNLSAITNLRRQDGKAKFG